MRPYLAIIKDSFREAFVSRVLWIVLILLALVLLLIFPFSYSFQLTTDLSTADVINEARILKSIQGTLDPTTEVEDSAIEPMDMELATDIFSLLPEKLRTKLSDEIAKINEDEGEEKKDKSDDKTEVGRPGLRKAMQDSIRQKELVTEVINQLIVEENLTSLTSLNVDSFSGEARDIYNNSTNASEIETQRFNRLVIEQILEGSIRTGPQTSIVFSYLGMAIPGKFPIEKERLVYVIRATIKYGLNFIFSTVGVLMALIITANVIPQTFDPGSLNLLLSKPISRSKLFIAQFLGGCAFVTLTMAFFFTGVWLFLGTRMGYWNGRLLFYIPSFIGIFAIYYTASAIAGLIWRSPIVSVIAGAGLWFLTFVMFTVNVFCQTSFNSVAFDTIDVQGDQIFVSYVPDNDVKVAQWNEEDNQWENISKGVQAQLGLTEGPVFDPHLNYVFGTRQRLTMTPFGPRASGNIDLLARNTSTDEAVFKKADLGVSVKRLFRRSDGRVIVFASGRLHLLERAPSDDKTDDGADENDKESVPIVAKELGPERSIRTGGTQTAVAYNPQDNRLAVLRRGKLSVYAPDTNGLYAKTSEADFDQLRNGDVAMAFAGDMLVVFHSKLGVVSINNSESKISSEFGETSKFMPKSLSTSPNGKYIAALCQNETLWVYNVETDEFAPSDFSREIKAVGFDDQGYLHMADRWLRIHKVNLADGAVVETLQGNLSSFQMIYKNVIYPIYYAFPKWGELNYTVEYLVTGSETADTIGTTVLKIMNVDRMIPVPLETYNLRPWPQVWNALIFITIMLFFGCVIIESFDY